MMKLKLLVLLLAFLQTLNCYAGDGEIVIDYLDSLGIPKLELDVPIYYQTDIDTAKEISEFVDKGRVYNNLTLGINLEFTIAAIDKETWEPLLPNTPYGLPWVVSEPYVSGLPSSTDNLFSNFNQTLENKMSAKNKDLILKSGLSFEEASHRFTWVGAFHELGHAYVNELGLRPQFRWFNELLASFIATMYLEAQDKKHLGIWNGFMNAYSEEITPNYTSFEEFQRIYTKMGLENYLWFHGHFQKQNQNIYKQVGPDFIDRVKDMYVTCPECKTNEVKLIEELDKIAPGFTQWAKQFNAGPGLTCQASFL